mgnify:CR=1 FL=1
MTFPFESWWTDRGNLFQQYQCKNTLSQSTEDWSPSPFDLFFNLYSIQPRYLSSIGLIHMLWCPNVVCVQHLEINCENSSRFNRSGLSKVMCMWSLMKELPSVIGITDNLFPYLLKLFPKIDWFSRFMKSLVLFDTFIESRLVPNRPLKSLVSTLCFKVSVTAIGLGTRLWSK